MQAEKTISKASESHTPTVEKDDGGQMFPQEKGAADLQHTEEANQPVAQAAEDFPDGGLRAWLVVVGVRRLFSLSVTPLTRIIRPCAILLQRRFF